MNPFPEDIFTEPENVDPDTLANLGPLRRLAGTWQSRKGVDLAPKAPGPERREYIERIDMQPIDPQANGPQLFYGLRYHVHINTAEEDITFHDQVGYWLWEPATGLVLQSLTIPRGQTALASGHAKPDDMSLVVSADARPDQLWHLLDRLPRICLPHGFVSSRDHVQCRRQLELCLRHHAEGARSGGTVPASRPQHAGEDRRARAQSAVPDRQWASSHELTCRIAIGEEQHKPLHEVVKTTLHALGMR